MSKRTLLTLFILAAPSILAAKLPDRIGAMVAYSSSNLSVDQIADFSLGRSGLGAGVFAEWSLGSWFSVLTQAQYAQKGFRERAGDTNELAATIVYTARLDYLSFPVLAKFSYPKSVASPYLVAGPRFDFLFHRRKGQFGTTSTALWAPESNFVENFKDFAFGATLGGGLELPQMGPVTPSLEVNYNVDFSNSFSGDASNAGIAEPLDVKNRSLDFWVKFAF